MFAARRSAGRDIGTIQVIYNHAVVRSLSPSKRMAKVNWSNGIDSVSGALNSVKGGQHSCEKMLLGTHRVAATTSDSCTRIYLRKKVKRTTPPSVREITIRNRFRAVAAAVIARREDLTKVTTDQAAFLAQKDLANGKKTMRAYLWSVCGAEYDAQNS